MSAVKASYTIACSSAFRDAVLALADKRGVNAGDLARAVMLVVPAALVEATADPGEPTAHDRETITPRSGRGQGRSWKRKPRLQVRLPPGLRAEFIRKCLKLALDIESGTVSVQLDAGPAAAPEATPPRGGRPAVEAAAAEAAMARAEHLEQEVERLRTIVNVLSFDPLPDGVESRADALHVMGFPPYANPDSRVLRARYRLLATVHHPDSAYGSHGRMSQINAAMELLRRG